ncbi:type II toxin-antitoxin system RelE/ParE family toxin [Bacterioplanoides sp. SCSIO 12839]|uniref:type II toxin-antitoxin system RelE/ParE family toxin n=1 Tax=Bacterioplanoides sp. SCSIO 12839 TaxID=2829569 RepID=UPI0021067343|nr:type II toxin-antitoxin system RelE/ParE family toxin [Bacterioplanoides sp. SCSIO 12839]UTW48357.1 type II toxin-antitoxin system RelE/ParE family toxin [Bacterioplanoides sp. SCSIO 12839]
MSTSLIINKLPQAERDLLDIWSYTARHWGEQKADEYLDELLDTLNRVALRPLAFPLKTDFKPAVRMALCNRHVLICQTDDLGVTLIRVMHQSANLAAYLSEE